MKFSKIESYWQNTVKKKVNIKRSLPPWHEAFLISPNVRFTRTPENEINRYHKGYLSQKSENIESDFRKDKAKKLTEERLRSSCSLVNLKNKLMMDKNNAVSQQEREKTSCKLKIVNNDNYGYELKTKKQEFQSYLKDEDVEEGKKYSEHSSHQTNHNLTNFMWISDSAFFEELNPSFLVNDQGNIISKQFRLSENKNFISKILNKTPECSQIEGSKTVCNTNSNTMDKKQRIDDKHSICQKSFSSEIINNNYTHEMSKKIKQTEVNYEHPCISLLQEKPNLNFQNINHEYIEKSAGILENILEDFGIRGEIVNANPGPLVTLYEFEPAPGTKSSRVIGLADDIARSMSSLSARVAVIPKRNAIGIELPNDDREIVYFRQLIESKSFSNSKADLPLCLGKTIGGEPVIADLAKMPHILVAGTTGSGKSVAINTMIMSLLYRLRPDECRMIMVDPKMLELSIYDGIPHLLTPVVTDPKKAVMALKWAVREMEERYKKMSRLSVRNIKSYNEHITIMRPEKKGNIDDNQYKYKEIKNNDMSPMPYIVIVVDEMADLMMVAGKEIEGAIQRLAQMARAAGIHLIMATQRPSVDVITGTIKANFPIRISFQVTSKIDSRTILGEHGAEQLLGQGDMLYMSGGGRIQRVHGPLVSDIEVGKVVQHLKTQGNPQYLNTVTADNNQDIYNTKNNSNNIKDGCDLYKKAIALVMTNKRCSTSFIQRRLQIGYNKAALLVERMEEDGLVSSADHVGKRNVFSDNNT
ncbi:DNA translocase FtsK [Candidatus Liberibacter americanus]|uniref:DNA segregation ATPase FtsK/SpoIIIE n=1 Tax=Candidatus Liberibacter americanus str. Sao Paulo TaxID=1261131 RepID=U6B5M4_9HYPH|nr:DNA translocase FtsK [Candidatus Liberibacter americanus]AHA28355.1 DNA segregation ATPase FtsK/SpoIIIE [Candidatus Liberibacter americanus str. Sao Paulo]